MCKMTGNRVKLNNINTVKLISRKLERIARAREKRFGIIEKQSPL